VTRILIADDHPIVRRGLKDTLRHELKDAIFEEAENAQQVLTHIRRQAWDLVILDVSMPGRSGIDLLNDIKTAQPEAPVLVLSVHPEQQYGKRVLQAGASGYANKASATEELVRAVNRILAGGRYVSPALAEWLALDLSAKQKRPLHEGLSDRELEVLRMIGSGRTVSQIAEDLHLSVTTVSTYRARILEKMAMTTTAELMHYALTNNLAD
jgi:two-component system invasion response regulator UvrY